MPLPPVPIRRVLHPPSQFLSATLTAFALCSVAACQPADHASTPHRDAVAVSRPADPGAGTSGLTSGPTPTGPAGPVNRPIAFAWSPGAGAGPSVYRVTVTDGAERVLFEMDTRSATLSATPDLERLLVEGTPFYWSVAVLDAEGQPVLSTPRMQFTVR